MSTLRPGGFGPALLQRKVRAFPDPEHMAGDIVAVGGDLRAERLLQAYSQGIFPWFSAGDPILWWSPDPRGVLFPAAVHGSRSLRKSARRGGWELAIDRDFAGVVAGCAMPRADQDGTWITADMALAYQTLFRAGYAHSFEVYAGRDLVGGLYGVALGGVFFGESMFSRARDASKWALYALARHLEAWGFCLIDTQFLTAHLQRMGAVELSRFEFLRLLRLALSVEPAAHWSPSLELLEGRREA
ncbi:MAG: leucyl/phenylalanyl-tRNA--protein transferase [Acidithiobacillus caldus]|nr:leucyl/phenylalanyl-tRNA--protein transferase [Acidithiobacillus caldus]